MPEDIFIKIINDSASDAEKLCFYEELELNSDLREEYIHYKNLHTLASCSDPMKTNIVQPGFDNFWRQLHPSRTLPFREVWFRYAAIFVVALALGFEVHYLVSSSNEVKVYTSNIEYSSEKGAVSKIHLEDGSSIWLSSGSKINICKKSTGEMSATLIGEAYFDMIPDPQRSFVVDIGLFKVRDIGTKFDIRAYPDEPIIYAALADGQIELCKNDAKPMLAMKSGEYMNFNKQTKHLVVSTQDPSIATAWKDGKFVFIHKTLGEICHELESWYNVQITIRDKNLANTRYTSVIKRTTTVKLVLEMLSLTDRIHYKIIDRKEAKDIVYIF